MRPRALASDVAPPVERNGAAVDPLLALAPIPDDPDDRWGGGHRLPGDHPAWMRDTLSLSARARALLAKVKPVAIRVIAAWEHRARTIVLGRSRLSVDASGSYRLD